MRQAEDRQRWRIAVEEAFRESWGRYGCFPHPERHGAWFYNLADRLGAATPDQQRLLYALVMERVTAYEPPLSQPERVMRDTRSWLDEVVGKTSRSIAQDYFCR